MTSGYRDFSKYETNFNRFLRSIYILEKFETRVYVDDTVKDFVLQATQGLDTVSVYHYNCEPFRDGPGHTGTFGSICRFLPLFEEDLETVWISDIDIDKSFLNKQLLYYMKDTDSNVYINTVNCYDRKPWANVKYPIVAHKFISQIKFPKQLMTRFLNRILSGDFDDLIASINEYNTRKQPNKLFPYGMDEAFLNTSIYNKLKKENVNVMIFKDYFVSSLLSYNVKNFPEKLNKILTEYYKFPTPELFKKVKDIYREYIPRIVDKYPCLQELMDNLDSFKILFGYAFIINSSEL